MPSNFPVNADSINAAVSDSTTQSVTHPNHHNDLANAVNAIESSLLGGMPLIDKGSQVYNVKAYGATGDGATDDTAAIQSAIDAALSNVITNGYGGVPVFFPAGKYKITSTLQLYRSDFAFAFVDVLGVGHASQIQWYGSTTGTAIKALRLKHFRMSGLLITNSVAAGTTIGLLCTNSTGGTGTLNGVCESVTVDGFYTCVQLGEASGAASSEITWINLTVQNCSHGVYISSTGNTLNNQFHNIEIYSCSVAGIYSSQGEGVFVYGGASSGNYRDFDFRHGGVYHIYGFRSESNTAEWLAGGTTAAFTSITIIDCNLLGTTAADGVLIRTGGGPVTIIGSRISGRVNAYPNSGAFGSIDMINCGVYDTFAFRPDPGQIAASRRLRYRVFGCYQMDSAFVRVTDFPDEEGYCSGTLARTPMGQVSTLPTGGSVDAHRNQRLVRGVSGTSTRANNLRGSVTFAGAATAAVTFPTGTAEVQSLICTGASSGAFLLSLDGGDSDGIVYNSTAANCQTRLAANANIGVGNVTCSGGPLPNTAITITFAGNRGFGPQGLLTLAPISNTVVGGTPVVTRTTAGAGQPVEADASYYVSLSGSANETFWVTAKATTGFTINSSNAASTATVDWHLIR